MKRNGLEFMTFEKCKELYVNPNPGNRVLNMKEIIVNKTRHALKKQSDWVSCAKGVQSILAYLKDQKDFFIKSLQFKVEMYDDVYVVNRSLMMPSGSADNKNCDKVPAIRDFLRIGRYAGLNDCHWIARGSPRCNLRETHSVNLYGEAQATRWADRQKCKTYIEQNTAMYEAFATGLRKEIADSPERSSVAASTDSKIDCSKYDPNRQLTYKDSWGALGMINADAILKCASREVGGTNLNSTGTTSPDVNSRN